MVCAIVPTPIGALRTCRATVFSTVPYPYLEIHASGSLDCHVCSAPTLPTIASPLALQAKRLALRPPAMRSIRNAPPIPSTVHLSSP
ncbi:hypothetical protein COCCADRAFT_89298 [Bipolaris zeicola 26-R-13]|uniref:Uncharacterized protein n=1 Tax=Cochliobolus carbonum (strain 26-R-13) TaxID=930089 RepID=W6YK60_COCC2|nr:uncharacterized protein COCCADRAFT_89298 [Bipolaris zeicola 26-R-13]EUC36014.1 hypothetical protein COCCADRAFT_89298 [Bipolaris zeicola 26-R-13]